MSIYLIIPTYNEKENLSTLVQAVADNLRNYDYKILVVDDNSPDGTGKLAESLKEKIPLEVIHRSGKLGIGSAYIAGFKEALKNGADLVFMMDADHSHDPKDLPRLIAATTDADLVIGSRKIKGGRIVGWNWRRHLYSNGAMLFAKTVLNLKTKDITAGFRCFKRSTLEKITLEKIKSNGYAFMEELVHLVEKKGLHIKEIPVTFVDRQKGQSKLNKKDIMEFFKVMIKIRVNQLSFPRKRESRKCD